MLSFLYRMGLSMGLAAVGFGPMLLLGYSWDVPTFLSTMFYCALLDAVLSRVAS